MKLTLTVLALTALTGFAAGAIRQWTIAGRPVEGELTAINGDRITIKKRKGGSVVAPLVSLEQADRDFVAAEVKLRAEKAALAEDAAKLRASAMAKALEGASLKLDGRKLKSCDVLSGKAPQHYLLFWAGGWSSSCQEATAHFVKDYNEVFGPAKALEAVLLSCDDSREKLQDYMADSKLACPAVTLEKWQKVKLLKDLEPSALPAWKLVDTTGTVLAEGEAALKKARELAAGGKQ